MLPRQCCFTKKTITNPSNVPERDGSYPLIQHAPATSFCQAVQFAVQLSSPHRVMHITSNVMV